MADYLDVRRNGTTHQAGSDSLVTSKVFFRLKKLFSENFAQTIEKNKQTIYGFYQDAFFNCLNGGIAKEILSSSSAADDYYE